MIESLADVKDGDSHDEHADEQIEEHAHLHQDWLLRRQPGYALIVIATMALGIAATTVLASVAYGVLLKPLPWADAPRLVRLGMELVF